MVRLVSVFIVAMSLAGCMDGPGAPMAFGPPSAQTADELARLTRPQFQAWVDCAVTAAGKYISANESATTVARAAMTACRLRERELESALAAYNKTKIVPAEVVTRLQSGFTEELTQLIIDRRQDIKLAKAYNDEWGNCLIEAAGDVAARDLPLRDAVMKTYRLCTKEEDAFRGQLAKLVSNPSAEMERRKGRLAPILTKFVEGLRSGGGADRPKRPDMTI